MRKPVTAATLRREHDNRLRERERIAADYTAAADVLEADDAYAHRSVVAHLRHEAWKWRR